MRIKMKIDWVSVGSSLNFVLKLVLLTVILALSTSLIVEYGVSVREIMLWSDHTRQVQILRLEHEQEMVRIEERADQKLIQNYGLNEFRNQTLDHFCNHLFEMIADLSDEGEQLQRLRREH